MMMFEGTVKAVVITRGYGFIRYLGVKGRDLFFHMKDLRGGLVFDETLKERFVRFESTTDEQGRDRAINIHPAE